MSVWRGGCGCGGGSQRGSKIRWRAAHDHSPGHARPPTAAPATATSRAAPSSELIMVAAVGGAGKAGRASAVGGIGCLGFAAAPASRRRRRSESRGTRVNRKERAIGKTEQIIWDGRCQVGQARHFNASSNFFIHT
jgi:hypothetical protein